MLGSIYQHIITIPAHIPTKHHRDFMVFNVASICGALAHSLFLGVFLMLNITPLVVFNIGSIALFLFIYIENRKKLRPITPILCYLEVIAHGIAATIYLGFDTGFHFYLFVLFALFFLTSYKKQGLLFVVLTLAAYIFTIWYSSNYEPLLVAEKSYLAFLNYNNMISAALIVVVIGYYNRYAAEAVEGSLNQQQAQIATTNAELAQKATSLSEIIELMKGKEEELRQQSEEMRTTQDELLLQRKYVQDINKGLEANIEERTKALSEALSQAQKQESVLKIVEAELREKQHLMEQRLWIDAQLSHFDGLMRLHYNDSAEEFASAIMQHLAKGSNAIYGALFLYNNEQLQMMGGYACTPQDTSNKTTFALGEGLIGQVAKTQKTIILSQLPIHQARFSSSLVEIENGSIIVLPLCYNDKIQGVMELVSLQEYTAQHLELMERLGKNLASMMQHIKNNMYAQSAVGR